MAEYKNCPVCHTINPPTATECECGYRFREGEVLTDRDIARAKRRGRLRAAIGTAVVVAVIAVLGILTALYGVKTLLWILLGTAVLLIVSLIVLKIINTVDRKRKKH